MARAITPRAADEARCDRRTARIICTLTARRLKRGARGAIRSAWDPGGSQAAGRTSTIAATSRTPTWLSRGAFGGSLDELRDAQAQQARRSQIDRIGLHREQVLLDGSYEVIEELAP